MISIDSISIFLWDEFENIILVIGIILTTFIVAKVLKKIMLNFISKASKSSHIDLSHYTFLTHFLSGLIYIIGIGIAIYMIPPLRTLSVSIFASAGVLAIIIGFAAQQAFGNLINGLFIVLFKPFRVGDRVRIKPDISGIVEDITLRHTIIRNFENRRIVIPNSVIANEVVENSSIGDEKICRFIEIGISYDSDIKKAKKIMQQEAEKHPLCLDNRTEEDKRNKEPVAVVRVVGLGESSVNLRASVWAKDPADAFTMGCDLNESIKERFDKEGIEIPFPHRTIVYKKEKRKKK